MVGWQSSLGIFLGRKRTTFVEVQSFLGQVRVIESGVVDVDSGQVLERMSADPKRKHEGRRSIKGVRVDHVVVGLTSHQTVSRFIDLPNVDDERLAGLLDYEIERHLPFPPEEACYGFQKVSTSGATARVLVAAAKRTDVESALAKIERLGLAPTLMDVSSAATAAAVSFRVPSHQNRTIGVVRFEDAEATVDVMRNGILMSSRTIHSVQDSDAAESRSLSRGSSDERETQEPPRSGTRVPVEGYVTFSCDQMCGEGTVVNLSRKGLCVRTDERLEVGQSLRLSIAFQEMNDSLEVPMARVRWTTGRMHGLETVIVDNDVRARMQGYLSECQEGYRFPAANLENMAAANRVTTDGAASTEAYRHALEGYVAFSGGGVEGEGVVVEGSEGGWRIRSTQPVKVGMGVALNIALPELDDPVEVAQAKVRWTRAGEFGVQVDGDGGAIRSALQQCVRPSRVLNNEPRGHADLAEAVLAELQRLASSPIGLPERVILYGGSDDMSRMVQQESRVAVEQWNEIAPGIEPVALGLALRGLKTNELRLDLLPAERRIVRRDRTAAIFSALLVSVVILVAGWWGSRAMLERTLLAQLEEDVTEVTRKAEGVSALQKEYAALHTRMQVLEKLALSQGRSMNLLKEVVLLLPPDVLLQEFTLDGSKVRLRGSTGASAAALISAFEHSALLENAAFTAPISVQGKDRQAFEIAATIRALSPAAPVNREGKRPS